MDIDNSGNKQQATCMQRYSKIYGKKHTKFSDYCGYLRDGKNAIAKRCFKAKNTMLLWVKRTRLY